MFLKPALSIITLRKPHIKESNLAESFDIIIFGYDRVGHDFVETAKQITNNYLVVDYNPSSIKRAQLQSVPYRFGDAEDIEFLDEVQISKAKLVISTIPDFHINLSLLTHYLGAGHAASLISSHRFNREAFKNERARHLKSLEERVKLESIV